MKCTTLGTFIIGPSKSHVLVSTNVLIAPAPALAIVMEDNPDKVMLRAIINDDLSETLASWGY